MGYYTEKAKEVKAKQDAEVNELLQLIADAVEEKYIPISLYELILRQLAFQNPDILNGLKYYNRQCDK